MAKKGRAQIAVFVLCGLNELNHFEILRHLKFWQAWNLPTVYVHMLIKLAIVKTKSQQNDWTCELTSLQKSQYFITTSTETLKLFQNCILQSSLQCRGKKAITKQNTKNPKPWSMWLSPSLLKKDVKYLFQFTQSICLKEVDKSVHVGSWRMWTRSQILSYNCKQYICHLHSNHYFNMFHLKIYYACLLMLEQLYHKSSSSQVNFVLSG